MDIPRSSNALLDASRTGGRLSGLYPAAATLLLLLVLAHSTPVYAGLIIFDFLDPATGATLDNNSTGELSMDNLGVDLETAMTAGFASIFNQTATRFGINTQGTSLDSSSLIDNVNGYPESLSLSFSEHVKLEYIVLSLFSPGEKALLLLPGALPHVLGGLEEALDVFSFERLLLGPGESMQLLHGQGNGFSLESLAVSRVSVNEPSTFLLALGLLSMLISRASPWRKK